MSIWQTFTDVLLPLIWSRLLELLQAPAINPEMFWMIIPLIITLLLMTFYFGKYTKEELGWNSAIGNSIVLLFVAIDLLRYIFHLTIPGSILNYQEEWVKTLISLGVAAEGITLLLSTFFKALPKRITFFICSPAPVNLQAYVAIALVYTDVPFDGATLVSAILLFFILLLLLTIIKLLEHIFIIKVEEAKLHELETEQKKMEEEKKALKEQETKLKKEIKKQQKKTPS